ncbi:hypothetical protein GDO78_006878 [Eleutherodactylus coqui]|uniref:Uncharacterized protein n=1 Tax=Eleutherodactylus coqui TaxID=57060 RepID=A0A8J6FFP5_ELECQ|nr:hypothetical protein GDO78_006878 [Eleutherodactylus coqui]
MVHYSNQPPSCCRCHQNILLSHRLPAPVLAGRSLLLCTICTVFSIVCTDWKQVLCASGQHLHCMLASALAASWEPIRLLR